MAVSKADIQSYITDVYNMYPGNPAAANAVIAQAMDTYNVSPAEVASAMNADVGEVQSIYNQVAPTGAYAPTSGSTTTNTSSGGGGGGGGITTLPDYSAMVQNAYGNIGRSNPDAEGVAYWTQQLQSGNISPAEFERQFMSAAANVQNTALQDNINIANATNAWLQQNPNATVDEMYAVMQQNGLTSDQIKAATGRSPEEYAAANMQNVSAATNAWLQQNPNATLSEMYNVMQQNGLTANQIQAATGMTPEQYAAANMQNISNATNAWLQQNPYATQSQMLAQMQSAGLTADQLYAATGKTPAQLAQEQARKNATALYNAIGRTDIDQEGLDYWTNQYLSGVDPTQLRNTFLQSAASSTDPNLAQYANNARNLLNMPTTPTKLPTLPVSAPVTGEGVSTQFIREAPEIEAYKLGLLQEAKRLYETPINYSQLQYNVAGPSAMTLGSYDIAQQGIGAYQPFVQQGAETLAQGQGLAQQAATMGQLGLGAYLSATGQYQPGQVASFMNPYQQLVTDQALQEIRRQADLAGQAQAAQAIRTGAFGGTREGVQRAEMERNTQDIMSQRIAQDLAQNYAQAQQAAQGAYEAQQQRAIAAGQGIGSLTGTYGSLGQQLGQLGVQQAALGQAAQQGLASDVNLMNVLGQQQQAQEQAVLEAQRMSNYQQIFDPYTRLGFLSDVYKGAPSTQSTIAATSAQQPSAFQQLVGGVTSGIATAAGAQKLGLF